MGVFRIFRSFIGYGKLIQVDYRRTGSPVNDDQVVMMSVGIVEPLILIPSKSKYTSMVSDALMCLDM